MTNSKFNRAFFPDAVRFRSQSKPQGNFARRGRLMAGAREWSVRIMPDQTFVLVAEDEELVRLVIVQALLDEGFEVMEVEHAESALIVLESHGRRIHVLFTDIQMPGAMDGLALAHHTSKHWPWIGLLVTSARPPRIKPHFLSKADLWRSHTNTAMLFVVFTSWPRRPRACQRGGSTAAGTGRRLSAAE